MASFKLLLLVFALFISVECSDKAENTDSPQSKSDLSLCPSGMTQCGINSCCPLPSAVCCSDGVHCCPNGYTCNLAVGGCVRGRWSQPLLNKMSTSEAIEFASVKESAESENSLSLCPSGMTQCGINSCCPLPSAVCCSDGVHCCPNGYTCNLAVGGCVRGRWSQPFLNKMSTSQAIEFANVKEYAQSENSLSLCPSGMTQCGINSCCPLPSAVCCSDGVHCCPNGYTCNLAVGGCVRGRWSQPFLNKMSTSQAIEFANVKESAQSENSLSLCPSGMTQCGINSCCPLPSAVCCSDGVHCCPNGYTCNLAVGGCVRGRWSQPFLNKMSTSQAIEFANVKESAQSENSLSLCPSGMTQCGINSCCPLPSAVCCSDGVHCCPNGYTCNLAVGGCVRGRWSQPFLNKMSTSQAIEFANVKESAQSENSLSLCPSGMTQCGINSCCPLPSAVCCSDGVHCCPNGYTCNLAVGGCVRGRWSQPFLNKMSTSQAIEFANVKESAQSENSLSLCPSGMTQCGINSCCPLPSAVCCSDGVHCCPNGYTCNLAVGGCVRGRWSQPFLNKMSTSQAIEFANVKESAQSENSLARCPSGMTQCRINSCCPFRSAVCCSDGVHCCPNGYTCNFTVRRCLRRRLSQPFLDTVLF